MKNKCHKPVINKAVQDIKFNKPLQRIEKMGGKANFLEQKQFLLGCQKMIKKMAIQGTQKYIDDTEYAAK